MSKNSIRSTVKVFTEWLSVINPKSESLVQVRTKQPVKKY